MRKTGRFQQYHIAGGPGHRVCLLLPFEVDASKADPCFRIPLVAAVCVFVYLHRRHVRKLRREDANDPHKSLDFGMDPSNAQTTGKKNGKTDVVETAEMSLATEKSLRRGRGMSMDMGSPYLLPSGLQSSRESLHSLSRTMHSGDDRYRPATTLISKDSTSMHSYPKSRGADDSSSYAESGSSRRGYGNDSMNQNLLSNAQGMSKSVPPIQHSPSLDRTVPEIRTPEAEVVSARKPLPAASAAVSGLSPGVPVDSRESYMGKESAELRKSNNYLGHLIHSREPSADLLSQPSNPAPGSLPASSSPSATLQQTGHRKSPPPAVNTTLEGSRPPRLQSLQASNEPIYNGTFLDNESDYGESLKVTPSSPKNAAKSLQNNIIHTGQEAKPMQAESSLGVEAPALGYDARRLSMGVRPLPPDDPSDNPEQRANRIRSFYKEYFDDSKPGPTQVPAGAYIEDYGQEYLSDGAVFDPVSGQFVVAQPQFSVPYSRRAMTPPPRAPPRFQGPARHHATSLSGGRSVPPGPRAYSSASGHFGPSSRGSSRPALPPPSPLRVLPSPHLLNENSFALPIDFAPPNSYKDRQAGRPESPRGGMRPYSPMLPAHLPLASSFDDLSVMPSP